MHASTALQQMTNALRPNRRVARSVQLGYAVASAAVFGVAWSLSSGALPSPAGVAAALARLWTAQGLFDELVTSVVLNAQAIAWTTAIALGLAYATVVPAVRPIATAISKLRFSGLVGWAFVFTLWARDGHQLKLWMLVFGMAPFFVTAMAAAVAELPRERFDHARALGLTEWRTVREVVIRGTLDQALEALRQNAAMGWMALTMVEGLVRSEGGVGALMLNENKHLDLDAVFALIVVVLIVGIAQDAALAWLRRTVCPYAHRSAR